MILKIWLRYSGVVCEFGMAEKYWFYWCFEWFWDWIFGSLLDKILLIECDFGLSSIEALFYKGLMGFLVG